MKYKITVDIFKDGVEGLAEEIANYQIWLSEKSQELAQRLAELGATYADQGFANAFYDGSEDHTITVQSDGPAHYIVRADGKTVLFVEFGAGVTMGYGHPEAGENGMGPGTYPGGKGHWNDPKGWSFFENGQLVHTFGNPPNAPMYNAVKTLEQRLESIVREVFAK